MSTNTKKIAEELWKNIIQIVAKDIDCVIYVDVWLKTLEAVSIEGNTLILSSITVSNIKEINNVMPNVLSALKDLNTNVTNVKIVKSEVFDGTISDDEKNSILISDNDDYIIDTPMLDSKYTFKNFIVGQSNQHVHAAALSVAKDLNSRFNPLFIYGGVGLGKTHIIQAIGHYVLSKNKKAKVVYVPSDKFMNDFIDAIRKGDNVNSSDTQNISYFRKKYREADILIIDDIQFFSKNAEKTQEELFNTFNELKLSGKQIILSSDRHPNNLSSLTDRLRSRFSQGLIIDIKPPDIETKVAILKHKSQNQKYNISNDVLTYIAENSVNNIRDMEGNLNNVIFFSDLERTPITLELARSALLNNIESSKEDILDIDKIIYIICDYFKISFAELLGKKRTKNIVEPRQFCIYLITEFLSLPLSVIAEKFNRDHTTIIHARDKIIAKVKEDPNDIHLKNLIAIIKNE